MKSKRRNMAWIVVAALMQATIVWPVLAQSYGQSYGNSNDGPVREYRDYNAFEGNEPTAGQMAFDGVIVRPVMFGATILGSAIFITTLPFSALGGNVGGAAQRLVAQPARATFQNCLGCLPGRYSDLR